MCQQCVERLNMLPPELLAVLEKHRGEMTELAKKMGDDISKYVIHMEPSKELDDDARRMEIDNIRSRMGFVSLAWAVGYATTANDHSEGTLQSVSYLFSQALELGFYKSGQEEYQAKLN